MAISKLPNLEEKMRRFFPPYERRLGGIQEASRTWSRGGHLKSREENGLSKALVKSLRAKVDLCGNASGRKCRQVFTNTIRNSVKTRDLAFKYFGRKCCKKTVDSIVVSEKIITFASQ